MSSLEPLFAPRGIAVVGASRDQAKLGAVLARSLRRFPGTVAGINPRDAGRVPVVALVVGRSDVAEFAQSHTGALATSWRTTRAALSAAGAVIVDDERQLVDAATALSAVRLPALADPAVGVVTAQAGPGLLHIDARRKLRQGRRHGGGRPGDRPCERVRAAEPDAFDLPAAIEDASVECVVVGLGGPSDQVAPRRQALRKPGIAAPGGPSALTAAVAAVLTMGSPGIHQTSERHPHPSLEAPAMTTVENRTTDIDFDGPEHQAKLDELYRDFAAAGMTPLWTTREGLMPAHPTPRAVPHLWRWNELYPLAARSGELVPVGRGGERRAISLGNPGLPGDPYTTPTLWAAIQYLAPRENAPEHRHSQSAFRFVLEGEGVWTVVDGDPVAMRRGDLLLTPGWRFHGHQNVSDEPMAWLDGLDIPLVSQTDQGFFEFGPEIVSELATPARSRNERLWGGPGLTPLSAAGSAQPSSPLMAYRWEYTDAALAAQLELEDEGHPGVVSPGHAAIRFTNPTTGGDALTTMRTEMHRVRSGAATRRSRTSASSVWQVFEGTGTLTMNGQEYQLRRGDVIAVPAWTEFDVQAADALDFFTFSDAPVFEKLNLLRTEVTG